MTVDSYFTGDKEILLTMFNNNDDNGDHHSHSCHGRMIWQAIQKLEPRSAEDAHAEPRDAAETLECLI